MGNTADTPPRADQIVAGRQAVSGLPVETSDEFSQLTADLVSHHGRTQLPGQCIRHPGRAQ